MLGWGRIFLLSISMAMAMSSLSTSLKRQDTQDCAPAAEIQLGQVTQGSDDNGCARVFLGLDETTDDLEYTPYGSVDPNLQVLIFSEAQYFADLSLPDYQWMANTPFHLSACGMNATQRYFILVATSEAVTTPAAPFNYTFTSVQASLIPGLVEPERISGSISGKHCGDASHPQLTNGIAGRSPFQNQRRHTTSSSRSLQRSQVDCISRLEIVFFYQIGISLELTGMHH